MLRFHEGQVIAVSCESNKGPAARDIALVAFSQIDDERAVLEPAAFQKAVNALKTDKVATFVVNGGA